MGEPSDATLARKAASLGECLRGQGRVIATAESCTGGWVAKCLTDTSGSSDYFETGLVTYSNEAKEKLLGVPAGILAGHGAVSSAVASAMVSGTLEKTGADVALAVSGIAGPGGGSAEKPVGTVWFGWGVAGSTPVTTCKQFEGDRDQVRREAVEFALKRLKRWLQG
ncbi:MULTISPECIES: CinA family protein [Gammaproteobacteria]|jgi:nicotinamide-nucleotide amidase|uniref:Nicotinamide-nucleotide amidohydrolase family protein n=1 Tax=Vreelandella halophila TaxID=86177 RepID=A0A9X5B5M6_9GAMM|nr:MULTISPECIES: CinA family protein [Gammaproteobacteria]KAA8977046.1 CinA family protein [Halospina sp. K52047b]MYL26367.1 nicotinamide-nucleotide amidohydrolase family protein [Halomonas utahensis]MYL73704.1 nicotinamide-nucleotide amidohydrolase family protein [Halomonas sp. 22501_18_FS]